MLAQTILQKSAATGLSTLFDGPERTLSKGVHIFCPGDAGDGLFLLRRGLVRLSTQSAKGDDVTLRVCRPPEVFGEGCFAGAVRRHWATALEPSAIVEAPAGRVLESIVSSPDLAVELIAHLSERLTTAYDELQTVSSRIAVIRVAARLLVFANVEAADTGWTDLASRFTHEELAQIVGIRRETLTRALARLKALGLIRCEPGRPMRVHRSGLEGLLVQSANHPITHQIARSPDH